MMMFRARPDRLLVIEVLERLARLDNLITALSGVVSERERDLLNFYQEQLSTLRLDSLLDIAAPELLQGERLEARTIRSLQSVLLRFYPFHWQFSRFTRFPEVWPEVTAIVEEVLEPNVLNRQPAIVYSPEYNYFESSVTESFVATGVIDDKGTAGEYIALLLPYSEFRNPLAWANLVHELAHAIAPAAVENAFSNGPEPMTPVGFNWAQELFCDMIAVRTMGPAYFCAFCAVLLSLQRTSWNLSETHPQPHERLRIMKQYLEDQDLLTPAAVYYHEAFEDIAERIGVTHYAWADAQQHVPGAPSAPVLIDNLWAEAQKLPVRTAFSVESRENALCLARKLLGRIPLIASYARNPIENTPGTLDCYRNDVAGLTDPLAVRERTYQLLSQMEEVPATSAEILTAAWELKAHSAYDLLSALKSESGDSKQRQFIGSVARFDENVIKSLETARVHSMLKESD